MSTNNTLYVRGMDLSESEREAENEDTWDDKKLNDAYDKALRMANAEVAKRVAMSTNTQHTDKNVPSNNKNIVSVNAGKSSQKMGQKIQWKAGMPCRAVYDADGQEYEAFLLRIINEKECVVRFLGYDNSEIVDINSLKQTLGKAERTRQVEDSLADKLDGAGSETFHVEKMGSSDRALSVESSDVYRKKKSAKKKKPKQRVMNGYEFPEMPLPMPDFSQIRNLGSLDMPIPPPPPLALHPHESDTEDQAVSSMLLSWYMSGYYTGLYQGMKRAKESRRN